MARNFKEIIQTLFFGIAICTAAAKSYIFRSLRIEVGFHQYAERVDPTTLYKMPYNAAINIGYIIVGIYWLKKVGRAKLSSEASHYFDMFAMMSIMYGPVQFLRIVTQQRLFAILDQWFTLPIFAWAALFGLYALSRKRHPSSENVILCLSTMSYVLTLLTGKGFEIALGFHIIIAVLVGLTCQWKLGTRSSLQHMNFAVLCCAGFVILKIYDLELGRKHWIFKRVSGHFLSKICDILQIHFVAEFFLELLTKHVKVK